MPRRARLINALSKGELDPELGQRLDLAHFYNSVKQGTNVQFTPQGGVVRRFSTMLSRPLLRRRLDPVPLASSMLTVHNGGTKANLIDEDPATVFTTNAVGASPFVVIEIDLGVALPIAFVDLIGFKCANAVLLDNAIVVEWYNGATWLPMPGPQDSDLSPRRHLRQSARTRRFGAAPGTAITARNWRVTVYNGTGVAGAVTISNLRFWREKDQLSALKLLDFAKSGSQTWQLALTDRNIDVFDNGVYLASIPVDIAQQQIAEIKPKQSQDTLFLFHADVATVQVVRQGSAEEWNAAPAAFASVPTLSTDTAFAGQQDEVQDISFSALAPGETIVLFLGGQQTAPITFVDAATLPGQIVTALTGLPGIAAAPDLVADLRSVAPITVRVRFTGTNGGRAWPPALAVLLGNDDDEATTTIVQPGIDPDGLMFSPSTGWPRCGAIAQGRILVGGMRSAPQTIAVSRVGSFDFTREEPPEDPDGKPLITADMGFLHTFDTDRVETIREIFIGRHLQVFTETGEWWLENRSFDATQPRNFILATRYGAASAVPVVFGENATLFVQDGGRTLRDFLYSDVAQNYEAGALSLLAPHLLTGVIDMAYRAARSTSEGNLIVLVNADGSFALLTLLRDQEIIAFSGCSTPHGQMRASIRDAAGRIWFGVERDGRMTLEQAYDGSLDAAVSYAGAPITVMTGLGHLEGHEVYAWIDRDLYGPFTVADGEIDLPIAATEVLAGLAVIPLIRTQALREKLTNEQPFKPPARVYEVDLALSATGQAMLSANDGPLIEVPLRNWNGAPLPEHATGDEPDNDLFDVPVLDRLYTGEVTIEDLEGWTDHASITVTQTVPAPWHVRAIRYQISY